MGIFLARLGVYANPVQSEKSNGAASVALAALESIKIWKVAQMHVKFAQVESTQRVRQRKRVRLALRFWMITDRRRTKCIFNPIIYLVFGFTVAIFVFLKVYYNLKKSAMHSANEKFQNDLNALGGMDTLTNLRNSFSFGMNEPLIPNTDRKVELDLVEVKTSREDEQETTISSTPLEVIDAWEKLEYKIYRAKNSKELTQAFHDVLQFSKRLDVKEFLKTKKQKMLSISMSKKVGGLFVLALTYTIIYQYKAEALKTKYGMKVWRKYLEKCFKFFRNSCDVRYARVLMSGTCRCLQCTTWCLNFMED